MARTHFGDCIGCAQPIRPPYFSFIVSQSVDDSGTIWNWEEVDVCEDCAAKLPVQELCRLVAAEEEAVA